MIVVGIDPGHGANREGAVFNGHVEKDINLAVAMRLRASLTGTRVVTILTRESDINPGWDARYQTVSDAEFVVSVHFNANAPNRGLHGAEGYHYPGNDFSRQVCLAGVYGMPIELASSKLFAATDNPGADDDWLQRPLTVIEAFREKSVALIECGYLSNSDDADYLYQPFAVDEVVNGLRAAVLRGAQLIGD
jgi:N-acetylmuramoyl-L-alanine amidase